MHVEFRHMRHENQYVSFAFITVNSPRMGKKIIAKCSGLVIAGVPVEVREFVHRCSGNERRSIGWRNEPWKFFERRQSQRRRYRQVLEMEEAWFKQEPKKSVQA